MEREELLHREDLAADRAREGDVLEQCRGLAQCQQAEAANRQVFLAMERAAGHASPMCVVCVSNGGFSWIPHMQPLAYPPPQRPSSSPVGGHLFGCLANFFGPGAKRLHPPPLVSSSERSDWVLSVTYSDAACFCADAFSCLDSD